MTLIPISQLSGLERSKRLVSLSDRVPFVWGPYETNLAAYATSKVAALQAAEAWIETKRLEFDVVYLHSSFVEARNDLAVSTPGVLKLGMN
jgi:hypothetical protein